MFQPMFQPINNFFLATVALVVLLALPMAVYAQGTDPISVVIALDEANNAHDIDAALALFADDAVAYFPGQTPDVYTGKEGIRTWLQTDYANNIHVESRNFKIVGDKVTFITTISVDSLRKMGIDSIESASEAVVQGGKIKSFTVNLTPESLATLEGASVVLAFDEANNAHDINAALAVLADDAVVYFPGQPPPNVLTGKEQIREWLELDNYADNVHVESRNFKIVGDKVTFITTISVDSWRKMGIDSLESASEAVVQGGKIKSFTVNLTPESLEKLKAASLITGMAPVNDIQMYYEIHGEGQPLILLHGGLGNAGYWENQIPVLAEKYKVIAVDSRGQGRSTYSEQPIGYSLMASDVIALMDYLGIEKANIVGWSDGGIIGLDLAINHPERLHKLIAYGANYNPSGVRADAGENEKVNAYFAKMIEDYQKLSPDPSRLDALLENLFSMWASEPNFTPEQLGSITVPILVLDGEDDELIYVEHTKEMASLIPTAKLILIPGTGHFAPWEKPEEFNQIVLDYLAETEDFSNVFFMSLSAGLNMISLPLKPRTSYNARSFAEMLSATVVIKLDEARQRFVGFTLDAPDDGFAIEGGKGYIVNVPQAKQVAFVGAAWTNQPPVEAIPSLAQSDGAWAFVVSGRILECESSAFAVTVRNTRTNAVATDVVRSGYFAAAFANLSRQSVVEIGDQLEVTVMDRTGELVSDTLSYTVTSEAIHQALLPITLTTVGKPSQSRLLPNYPNPFNPETWIPYQLRESAEVVIRIYASTGQLVRTLSLGQQKAGFYLSRQKAAYWDGKNDAGEKVASGIYFYQLNAGDFKAMRRMVIVK